jgi:hypothetical protein
MAEGLLQIFPAQMKRIRGGEGKGSIRGFLLGFPSVGRKECCSDDVGSVPVKDRTLAKPFPLLSPELSEEGFQHTLPIQKMLLRHLGKEGCPILSPQNQDPVDAGGEGIGVAHREKVVEDTHLKMNTGGFLWDHGRETGVLREHLRGEMMNKIDERSVGIREPPQTPPKFPPYPNGEEGTDWKMKKRVRRGRAQRGGGKPQLLEKGSPQTGDEIRLEPFPLLPLRGERFARWIDEDHP